MTAEAVQQGFDGYVNLNEVDPNFTLLDAEVYNLRISKAERSTYAAKKAQPAKGINVGDEQSFVKLTFTVTGHPKFTGRKHWESLFFSDFNMKVLRRIADATGIPQEGSFDEWLKELTGQGPTVRLKVDQVPDTVRQYNPATGAYDNVPNPRTAKPTGEASTKNVVDWKAGVQSGE